ncbi:hypothetical protein P7K49_027604 [Saguinus oedipus]|uniref:Uncharacterized protein n=1 Tax=Saguinus oedipus TaxID=9490 RepID=A0ABQ9UA00_SAGOE|nr:hypothetical protein P7K49_027604 [Saguinus oedipus]
MAGAAIAVVLCFRNMSSNERAGNARELLKSPVRVALLQHLQVPCRLVEGVS